jgi:hypothetical protein
MKILSTKELIPYGFKFPTGARGETQTAAQTRAKPQAAGQRNHGAVIGAKFGARKIQLRVQVANHGCQTLAQAAIRAYAAGNNQTLMARLLKRAPALFGQSLNHGILKSARDVGADRALQIAAAQGY